MCRGRKSAVSYDPEEVVCMFYLQNFMKKLILQNILSSEMLWRFKLNGYWLYW